MKEIVIQETNGLEDGGPSEVLWREYDLRGASEELAFATFVNAVGSLIKELRLQGGGIDFKEVDIKWSDDNQTLRISHPDLKPLDTNEDTWERL